MDNEGAQVRKLLRQQASLAVFGSYALRQTDLHAVLTEAARACATGLNVPYCKVCKYRPEHHDLLIVAGYGWNQGVIGNVISRADDSSPQGRAFVTGRPAICNDLRRDTNFKLPSFYIEHRIISTIDVLIKGSDKPYGVLEIDSNEQHDYDQHDIDFLTGFANVLAEAVATAARTALLKTTIEQMRTLVEEKDRLLDQKMVLAEELQHRVRNNLQLIYDMLSKQMRDSSDEASQRGLKAIARRVTALAQVYNHLLGSEMSRTTDFGNYVKSLCATLTEIQTAPDSAITLTCDSEPLLLDLDVVTALGLVVAELVTNIYDHAFPNGIGVARVSVHCPTDNGDMATMTVSDDGVGFVAGVENKRYGVGLVRRLVEQIRGTATMISDRGTTWTINFPVGLAPVPAAAS
jgi:two-component sensor histidine kinase